MGNKLSQAANHPLEFLFLGEKDREHDIADQHITDAFSGCCFCFWLVMLILIIVYGTVNGKPGRLTHAIDYQGRLCGTDDGVASLPYGYWCADSAWDGDFPSHLYVPGNKMLYKGATCLASCPTDASTTVNCPTWELSDFNEMSDGVYTSGNYSGATFSKHLEITVTQSVVAQKSYATEAFRGQFCLPTWSAESSLRSEIINGPLSGTTFLASALGSLVNACPLIFIAWCCANCCGWAMIGALMYYTGIYILAVESLTVVLLFILSVFFLVAACCCCITNSSPHDEGYKSLNLFYSAYDSVEARCWSITTGILMAILALLYGAFTYVSMPVIDRSIGIFFAAREVFMDAPVMFLLPVVWSFILIGVVLLLMYFFQYVMSLGSIDSELVKVGDYSFSGLMSFYSYEWYQQPLIVFYLFMTWWTAETVIQMFIYTVGCAGTYYFLADQASKGGSSAAAVAHGPGKNVKVRVAGADNNLQNRDAMIQGDKLVVDLNPHPSRGSGASVQGHKNVNKGLSLFQGKYWSGLFMHFGSFTFGALMIPLWRIFRCFANIANLILLSATKESSSYREDVSVGDKTLALVDMFAAGIKNLLDILHRNTYTHMFLEGELYFIPCCFEQFDKIQRCGGGVLFLMSSLTFFEFVNVFFFSLLNTMLFTVLVLQVDIFTEPDSDYYVADPIFVTFMIFAISLVTIFMYTSLFNHVADTLLYNFDFWRSPEKGAKTIECCPVALKSLLKAEVGCAPGPVHAHTTPSKLAYTGATAAAPPMSSLTSPIMNSLNPAMTTARANLMSTFR